MENLPCAYCKNYIKWKNAMLSINFIFIVLSFVSQPALKKYYQTDLISQIDQMNISLNEKDVKLVELNYLNKNLIKKADLD